MMTMALSNETLYYNLETGLSYIVYMLSIAVAIAGVLGLIKVIPCRRDAFDAAGRRPKEFWAVLLLVAVVMLFVVQSWIFIAIGMVIIGIYWFDVYPDIRDLLEGNNNW